MGQKTNIIEINGKKYDARTGDLLDAPVHAAPIKQVEAKSVRAAHDVARPPARTGSRHPQKSKTLIRQAVKKPAAIKRIKVSGHTDALTKQDSKVAVKKPARSLDVRRVQKARHVPKSNLITHFVPVTAMDGPAFQAPALNLPLRPLAASQAPTPKKAGRRPRTTADLLDMALQNANSHENAPVKHKPRHKRHLKSAALSAAALLLLAFVGWQQLPNARLQLASAKAGFNVNQPGYLPAGYSLADMKYSQGSAAISFHSNSDDRSYTLAEQTSNWNDQDLLGNFVQSRGNEYQSAVSGGRTVYLYGNGNATWLNDGVWYVLQSDGSLSQRQLLDIAASI